MNQRALMNGLHLSIGLAILCLAVRTWVAIGLVVPVVIHGDSMGPHWWGEHFVAHCRACGHTFRFASRAGPAPERMLCPNCHDDRVAARSIRPLPGRRVMIDRASLAIRSLGRWDLVAFTDPQDPQRLLVKRVVGLPREKVFLRDGELYVDDQLVRKPWPVLDRIAIPVHGEPYAAAGNAAPASHWFPLEPNSRWHQRSGQWHHPGTNEAGGGNDWLEYRPAASPAVTTGQGEPWGILDDYAYNQRLSRTLYPVRDLILQVRVTAMGQGALELGAADSCSRWSVQLGLDGRYHVLRDGQSIRRGGFHPTPEGRLWQIDVSLCDRQLLVRSNGCEVVRLADPEAAQGQARAAVPFRLASHGLQLAVHELHVLRDIYYLRPLGTTAVDMPYCLGADEYFVLGDNSPVSVDSRYYRCGPVPADRLVGRVRAWWGQGE